MFYFMQPCLPFGIPYPFLSPWTTPEFLLPCPYLFFLLIRNVIATSPIIGIQLSRMVQITEFINKNISGVHWIHQESSIKNRENHHKKINARQRTPEIAKMIAITWLMKYFSTFNLEKTIYCHWEILFKSLILKLTLISLTWIEVSFFCLISYLMC